MKNIFFVMILVTTISSLAFADIEFEAGFYGGYGIAGAAGFNTQLGYISPEEKDGIEEGEQNKFRWALLTDLGIGYRYSSKETYNTFNNYEHKYSEGLDFYIGFITEFYFLPFMGIAVGGGVTPGLGSIGEQPFTPYARAQIPFLFKNVKLGLGFDYIFWDGDDILPQGVNTPPGYRINLLLNLRGDLASGLFRFFGAWFSL